jgi:hypothetical protein
VDSYLLFDALHQIQLQPARCLKHPRPPIVINLFINKLSKLVKQSCWSVEGSQPPYYTLQDLDTLPTIKADHSATAYRTGELANSGIRDTTLRKCGIITRWMEESNQCVQVFTNLNLVARPRMLRVLPPCCTGLV